MPFKRETLVDEKTKWTKALQENVEGGLEELFERIKALETGGGGGGEGEGPSPLGSGHAYVTVGGNNARSGGSWGSAKASITEGIKSLPLFGETGKQQRTGIVHIGTGVFEGKSKLLHTQTMTILGQGGPNITVEGKSRAPEQAYVEIVSTAGSGSPTFTPSEDIGSYIINPQGISGGTEGTIIIEAWEGEALKHGTGASEYFEKVEKVGGPKKYYTVRGEPKKTTNYVWWIIKPAIYLPNTVILSGSGGPAAGIGLEAERGFGPTTLSDKGTGITIAWNDSSNPGPGAIYGPATGGKIENFMLNGNSSAIDGTRGLNLFQISLSDIGVRKYQRWGINFGANTMGEFKNIFVEFCGQENGEVGGLTAINGGGINAGNGSAVSTMEHCWTVNNWGIGCSATGMHAIGCQFNHSKQQKESSGSSKFLNNTGIGFFDESNTVPSGLHGGWCEGNAIAAIYMNGTTVTDYHFEASGAGQSGPGQYAFEIGPGGGTAIGCEFRRNFAKAIVKEAGQLSTFTWKGCTTSKAEGETSAEEKENEVKPFIERSKAPNIFRNAMRSDGYIIGTGLETGAESLNVLTPGMITAPLPASKRSLIPYQLIIGTTALHPSVLKVTSLIEGVKVAVVESGSTSKIVVSTATGGEVQATPFFSKASEFIAWSNEELTGVFKNRAFITISEGSEYSLEKLTKIPAKSATPLTPPAALVFQNLQGRDIRITQKIELGTAGRISFSRGSESGGQVERADKIKEAMALKATKIPLEKAKAKGYLEGSLVVWLKVTKNSIFEEGVPYWIVATSEEGIEISATESGPPIELTGAALVATGSELGLLLSWARSGSGESLVQDLYLPTSYYLTLALGKGATISGQAILTPA